MGVGVEVRGNYVLHNIFHLMQATLFHFWPTLFREMSRILIRNFGKVL